MVRVVEVVIVVDVMGVLKILNHQMESIFWIIVKQLQDLTFVNLQMSKVRKNPPSYPNKPDGMPYVPVIEWFTMLGAVSSFY